MSENIKCPKCGTAQPPSDVCVRCGVNIPKFIELQKRKKLDEGQGGPAQTGAGRERIKRQVGPRPPSEQAEGRKPVESERPVAGWERGAGLSLYDYHQKEAEAAKASKGGTDAIEALWLKESGRGAEIVAGVAGEREEAEEARGPEPLRPMAETFRMALDIYISRMLVLLAVPFIGSILLFISIAIPFVLIKVFAWLFPVYSFQITVWSLGLGAFLTVYCLAWTLGAAFYASASVDAGPMESFGESKRNVWGLAWLGLIGFFAVLGGLTLFAVPGIVLMVWFAFSVYVLLREDYGGLEALFISRHYARGRFGSALLRVAVPAAVISIAGIVPYAGPFLVIFLMPYFLIYLYIVYQDLRWTAAVPMPESGATAKLPLIGALLAGLAIAPVLLSLLIFKSPDPRRLADIKPSDIAGLVGPGLADMFKDLGMETSGEGKRLKVVIQKQDGKTEIYYYLSSDYHWGTFSLDGETLYGLKGASGENWTGNRRLSPGKHVFQIQYEAIRGKGESVMSVKIFRPKQGEKTATTLYDWKPDSVRGMQAFVVEIE